MKAFQELILSSGIIQDIKINPTNLWGLLQNEPPEDWVSEGISEITGETYKFLTIETLEFLMDIIFEGWRDKITNQSVILNSNCAIVHSTVDIIFNIGVEAHFKSGTASITVMDNFYYDKSGAMKFRQGEIKRPIRAAELLRTATPLCFTEAKKNAIKNICNLFGRNLNRETLENVPRGTIEIQKEVADIIIIRKYDNAVLNNDEKTIKEILNNYELPNA